MKAIYWKRLYHLSLEGRYFAIAHRLSTLRNADRLVVLDKGKIAEVGTHAELMAKKGEFCKLVETQSQTSKAIADTVAL